MSSATSFTDVRRADKDTIASIRGLRILHLGKYYPPAPGGIESHLETLACAQAELGLDVRVLCVNHGRGRSHTTRTEATDEVLEGVQVTRLGRRRTFSKLDLCSGLRTQLRNACDSADLVHLHVPNPTMLLALASLRQSRPIVITYHSDVVRQRFLVHLQRPFEDAVFRRAAHVLASSPPYAEASATLRRYADKVEIIPFGIRLEPFVNPSAEVLQRAAELREQFGQPLWLSIGRLVYYKGFEVAIQALADVPGKLLVIGTGPRESSLRDLAKRVGVADRIEWCGNVSESEMVAAYHAATALWFPSVARSEAFGLVQVEAMASGCPVINTAIPGSGVPWVSQNEKSGLTVPVNTPSMLSAAANQMLDRELRERLSKMATARAIEHFDHLRMARSTCETYAKVIGIRASQDMAKES